MVNTHQKYSRKIQTTKVQMENKDYRRPRHYRREEIEEAIQVEGRPEGGGPRQYRRADVEGVEEWCGRGVQQKAFAERFSRGVQRRRRRRTGRRLNS